ncbi:Type III pantothenate kinase [Rubripirellula obstinata]|uniref:Type III pantothenate kinase n=1 Tax=Rubripirellula obstinata TaxID=406547 RepID=A0A5B1CKR6_9BACT|nr:type III pantothenate kinase [Rubripirellula obstinata]KAA1261658.1 Type III pantothenate kinase [Rubripirellula obstinata]
MNPEQRVCTVAVDVGNTAVKLAVRNGNNIADRSIPICTKSWHSDAIDWVSDQLGCSNIRWLVSSVHRSAAESLIRAIEDRPSQSAIVKVIRHQDVPMQVCVDDPASLGIDRLLSAFAAVQLSAFAAVSMESSTIDGSGGLVVIDAGSAITVDWVDGNGSFRGGAILPGLRLQAKSLATGTDALPEIDWNGESLASLPATNTRDAIFGGILLGAAGAIDTLAQHYLRHDSASIDPARKSQVVITGGDAAAISAHLQCSHRHVPHLVCQGLLELGDG